MPYAKVVKNRIDQCGRCSFYEMADKMVTSSKGVLVTYLNCGNRDRSTVDDKLSDYEYRRYFFFALNYHSGFMRNSDCKRFIKRD